MDVVFNFKGTPQDFDVIRRALQSYKGKLWDEHKVARGKVRQDLGAEILRVNSLLNTIQ